MKKILYPLTFFILLLLLNGCAKTDINTFIPDTLQPASNMGWQNVIASNAPVIDLKNDLNVFKANDSVIFNNAGSFFSAGNLSLTIPANGLVNNAGLFTAGVIKRQSLLIQKKGDFIALGMPTVSNGRLLISGGAYFTSLNNNNESLQVAQGKNLELHYNTFTTLYQGMKLFNGTEDAVSGFNWISNTDTAFNKVFQSLSGYEVKTNKLQWLQTARYFDTSGIILSSLSLKLPNNYSNSNTVAYISFNDMQSVAGFTANAASGKFTYGSLPANKSITIVVISRQANDYYLGSNIVNTSVGSQEVIMTPVKTSLQNIKSFLDYL